MKKILQLFGGMIRHGGEEMFVYNCLKNYGGKNVLFDCLVIEDCENDDFRSLIDSLGGSLYELKTPLHATKFSNHIYKPVCDFFSGHSYDVVHIHSSSIAAIALLAAAADRAGTPKIIVHSHATGKTDSFEHRLFRFLASLSERRHADIYCACSREAALWKFAPKYAEKAIIVKNGIDTERFRFSSEKREATRKKLGIGKDSFVVGHVGRFCEVKNQSFLLEAFRMVSDDIPGSYLLLVGDGEDRDMLTDAAAQKGISDRVIMTGNVGDVENYLCAMDVFAFPSFNEGLGIVAVEAQCAGLPTVASTGVPREVEITKDVRFLPVDDPDAAGKWADAILGFCGARRKDNADAVALAGYDVRSSVEQLKEIYEK